MISIYVESALAHARASATCRYARLDHMHERDIFDEKQETKKAEYACPHCRQRGEYDVRWLKRTKKKQEPRNLNEHDRARFRKSQDYMVRVDDMLVCRNTRCRKRFEIPSSQSVVFI